VVNECNNHAVRIVGVDLGLKRVGLAISDPSCTLARPLRTIARGTSDSEAAAALSEAIEALAREDDGIEAVVVGLPTRLDGSDTEQTLRVRCMVDLLRGVIAAPIVLQDERLSSREAESRLAINERDWRKRKARLDAASAAVILQDYLDIRRAPLATSHGSPED
jgi:putative holliday junction resolvase